MLLERRRSIKRPANGLGGLATDAVITLPLHREPVEPGHVALAPGSAYSHVRRNPAEVHTPRLESGNFDHRTEPTTTSGPVTIGDQGHLAVHGDLQG